MTKKHFIAFAREIKADLERSKPTDMLAEQIAREKFELVCRVASRDNSKFDRERFRKACGLA